MAFWVELAQGLVLPLRRKHFRYFIMAQGLSLLGRWVHTTAQRWLLYELTGSSAYLGLLGALGSFPVLLLALPAGVIADHFSKRKVLIAAQSVAALSAFLLFLLVFTGLIRPWHILLLAFLLGVGVALEFPVRNAFIYDMVGREDLVSALSLHSLAFNLSRFLGPALAGWLMAFSGLAYCFLFNAASYLPVMTAVALMDLPEERKPPRTGLFLSLREGLSYAARRPAIKGVLLLVMLVSVGLFPYAVLLPPLTRELYHGGAREFSFFMAANGLGALLGAGFAGTLGRRLPQGRLIFFSALLLPPAIFFLTLGGGILKGGLLLALVGFLMVNIIMNGNARVQTLCEDEMRGRVLGLFSWCFFGLFPAGSLFWGAVAERVGAAPALRIAALVSGGLIFLLWWRFRHEA
ncbi:MFS transporter [Thermosulfurimonas sp. F29]|uniref:MFS transporter n=1 Tax=Thermosulfurimonas sp. F29 TaxID=2867247 RepID=UPI001C82CA88|nr:MFS transporter [Thermosulfurimonas sp. F29]MBX6423291.1 MFS transporter [Thermosulfurimonas sp. F29]